jgi:sulfur transfer complex TusBCD TusB component (DsrH family)
MASPEGVAKQKDLDSEFVLVNQTAFISILFGRNGTSKRNSAIDVFEKELQNHERLEELKRKIKYEQHTYLAKNTITTAQDKEKYDALVKANREKIKALELDVREKDQQIKAEAKKRQPKLNKRKIVNLIDDFYFPSKSIKNILKYIG